MNSKQLIYVSLDFRRALWVHEAIGAQIICSYDSDLLSMMRKAGAQIWCFQEACPDQPVPRGTAELLSHPSTLKHLRSVEKELEFVVFKPSTKIQKFVEKEGWSLRSAEVAVCRQLEDKVEFYDLATGRYQVPVPHCITTVWQSDKLESYKLQVGQKIIIQARMGHAGSSTYSPDSPPEEGTRVKISEFISGPTYTLNGFLKADGTVTFGQVWRQLMKVEEWNEHAFGTVGVTPAELERSADVALEVVLERLKQLLVSVEYQGFFGVDLIWDNQQWYVIEVNPRLTATVSLQYLQQLDDGRYSQIILRNTKSKIWTLPRTLKSGIYEQKEGSWKLITRSYDVRELEEGQILLLLAWKPGAVIDPGSDYASLQTKGSVLDGDDIQDYLFDFYERVVQGRLIREKDFWTEKFLKIEKGQPFLLRKPLGETKNQQNVKDLEFRYRHTQLLEGEVLQVLGEYADYHLLERADGTRGWLKKGIGTDCADGKASLLQVSSSVEDFFQHWEGKPYCYGGNSEEGIDCSAFVQRYFWETKGVLLPRNTQDQKARCFQEVEKERLQNDDLIFLHSREKKIPHVGIWKEGKVWHASLEEGVVCEDPEALQEKYELEGFKRV